MKDNICFCHSLERGQKPRIFLLLKSLSPLQLHKLQDRQNAPPSTNMDTTINVTIFTIFFDNALIICVFVCSLKKVSNSALIIFICLLYHFQSIMECWSALTLYVHIVVTASNTKVLPAPFFFAPGCLSAHPRCVWCCPDTSWCFPYTLWVLLSMFPACNGPQSPLQTQNVHNMGPNCVWASTIFFQKKGWIRPRADKEKKNQAVLLYCLR